MSPEQVQSAVLEIESIVRGDVHPDVAIPTRNQDAKTGLQRSRHLLWMCEQVNVFITEGRTEKAMRWLGFLQGAIWVMNLATIETMKKQNAPADATFNKERT